MQTICSICGRTFETNNPAYRYCSPECAKEKKRRRQSERYKKTHPDCHIEKECVVCGKLFKPIRNHQVTCSEECRRQHRNKLQTQRYEGDSWKEYVAKQNEKKFKHREELELKKAQRRKEIEKKKIIKHLLTVLKRRQRKLKNYRKAICIVCGEEFTTFNPAQVTCSKKCQKRYQHQKEDERYKGITIDKNITLESVYRKDSGTCYLCGCKCNWEDRTIRDDGTFIVGKTYPTIEHVKPISKGGLHEWKNIRLACWQCNTNKRDKIITV